MIRPNQYAHRPARTPGHLRLALRSLATALLLSALLASGMPALADTGSSGGTTGCGCPSGNFADDNPSGGRAVVNEELSEGDEVVVEFIPSDLPGATHSGHQPAPAGDTSIDGGTVENETSVAVDAQGGDAEADAAGGDLNLVDVVSGTNSNVEADAGSGGAANAEATGGTVVIGNVNSGANQGNQIEVDQYATGKILCFTPTGKAVVEVPTKLSQPAGNVQIDAGTVSNETNISVNASGGDASSDASGGSGNVVVVSGGDVDASAGSGGTANADASGGRVVIGDINSGGNQGNQITVGEDDGKLSDREQKRAERHAAREGGCVPPPCQAPDAVLSNEISGGDVSNSTDVAVDASGGDASADASGGADNIVQVDSSGGDVDASAGTGGAANADASGGVVEIGTVRSGGNTGNEIDYSNVGGRLLCVTGNTMLMELDLGIDGGTTTNETDIEADASGGDAETDASGGDGNIVVSSGSGNVDASAGSGGTADADASGGTIVIGDINSGGNSGSDVDDDDD